MYLHVLKFFNCVPICSIRTHTACIASHLSDQILHVPMYEMWAGKVGGYSVKKSSSRYIITETASHVAALNKLAIFSWKGDSQVLGHLFFHLWSQRKIIWRIAACGRPSDPQPDYTPHLPRANLYRVPTFVRTYQLVSINVRRVSLP